MGFFKFWPIKDYYLRLRRIELAITAIFSFRSTTICRGHNIYLISHFQINLGETCYIRGKLKMFLSKSIQNLSVFDASKIFYRGSKNAYF